MMKMSVLLCLLLWSLVEVQSQTEFPYFFFMGEILPNHAYVNLTRVGSADSGSDNVQCHTDLATCCNNRRGSHRGDWYFPNGDRLQFNNGNYDIFEARDEQRLDLRRRNTANSPSGIYRCDIPTNGIHDIQDLSVRETVYVGLYASGGDITISGGMTFTVVSELTHQFTLTCISTGGPATTVTWTRDSVTVTEGTETVLDDKVTAQYTHTLTVTGGLGGLYTCTVANKKPSRDSAQIDIPDCEIRGQVFTDCGTACPPVCGEEGPLFCTLQCVVGCQCPPGTLLDRDSQQCVTECPPESGTISLTSSPSSSVMAGDTVTLTCSVTLPDGETGTPDFQWEGPGGVTLTPADSTTSGQVVSSVVTLSNIRTSQAGQYNCTTYPSHHTEVIIIIIIDPGCIIIIIISYSGQSSPNSGSGSGHIPPSPEHNAPITHVVAGTDLTFTCTATLPPSIDNNENIIMEWSGLQSIPEDRYSVTDAMRGSGSSYTGSLTISPLADQDDGTYTCTVTVTGGTNVQSATASKNITITVIDQPRSVTIHTVNATAVRVSWDSNPHHSTLLQYTSVFTATGAMMGYHETVLPPDVDSTDVAIDIDEDGYEHNFTLQHLSISDAIPAPVTIATFAFDKKYFQIQFGPIDYCLNWGVEKTRRIEDQLQSQLTLIIRRHCYTFSTAFLRQGLFLCHGNPTTVTYRSTLVNPFPTTTSTELVGIIQSWVSTSPSLTLDGLLVRVSPNCTTCIASLDESECVSAVENDSGVPEILTQVLSVCAVRALGQQICTF